VGPLAAGRAEGEGRPRPGPGLAGRPIGALLFDYGLTLVTFQRPVDALLAAHRAIAERLEASGLGPVPAAESLLHGVHDRVEQAVDRHERAGLLDEIDLVAEERRAYAACGLRLPDRLLEEAGDLVQRAWWEGIRVAEDVGAVLTELRGAGLRIGLCSNAPYSSRSLHAQLRHLGLLHLFDSVTFSGEVGRRKPAPEIFEAALAALGSGAVACAMVGDRRREDVAGARAVGMATIRTREHHDDPGPGDADAVIDRLGDLPALLRDRH